MLPVIIGAGALGPGMPVRDLRVSQQHRILVRGPIAQRMFGSAEVLVPAKALLGQANVRLAAPAKRTYFHVALPDHGILFAEGAPAESFFPGPQALRGLSVTARQEFLTLFPAFADCNPARPIVTCRRVIARHRKNGKVLIDGPILEHV